MNSTVIKAVIAFVFIGIILLAAALFPAQLLPARPTQTFTPITPISPHTLTPLPTDTFFTGFFKIDSLCLSGASMDYEVIAKIDQGKNVMLMGKDHEQAWVKVRLFTVPDCWVETKFLSSDDIAKLEIVDTPPPVTFTPTATLTPVSTETPAPTDTRRFITYTPSRTRRPGDPTIAVPASTNTRGPTDPPPPTNTDPPPPTNTPKDHPKTVTPKP